MPETGPAAGRTPCVRSPCASARPVGAFPVPGGPLPLPRPVRQALRARSPPLTRTSVQLIGGFLRCPRARGHALRRRGPMKRGRMPRSSPAGGTPRTGVNVKVYPASSAYPNSEAGERIQPSSAAVAEVVHPAPRNGCPRVLGPSGALRASSCPITPDTAAIGGRQPRPDGPMCRIGAGGPGTGCRPHPHRTGPDRTGDGAGHDGRPGCTGEERIRYPKGPHPRRPPSIPLRPPPAPCCVRGLCPSAAGPYCPPRAAAVRRRPAASLPLLPVARRCPPPPRLAAGGGSVRP